MDIKILMIDDDEVICSQIKELFDGLVIENSSITLEYLTDFDEAINVLGVKEFDLVILDLFRGKPEDNNSDRPGETVLAQIKKACFIPVVFFTGMVNPVEHLKSDIVRVVRKGDATDSLKKEIQSVVKARLPFIKKQLNAYIKETMRKYFWDFVHPNWKELEKIKDEVSLGYLIVRRLASSLSKKKIITLLGDPKISEDKVHPMEFYIYPPIVDEYEMGDVLEKNGCNFVILTPSCDFVREKGRDRKADIVLLAKCIPLTETEVFKKYKKNNNKYKGDLKKFIESRKSDRYFFLPKAPFIENSIIDFQNVHIEKYSDLVNYSKKAKIDDPFCQSMLASFIRYYNRVGFPDIDFELIIRDL